MEIDTERRANDATLTEAHVVRLLSIEDRADWGVGLVLRKDGIYRRDWTNDELRLLSPNEFAAIVGSGRGGLLLRLPCGLDEFERFVDAECLRDSVIDRRIHLLRVTLRRRCVNEDRAAETVAGLARQPMISVRPVQRQVAHEAAILQALRRDGFDPLRLPAVRVGKVSPAKRAARTALSKMSTAVFDKAWERLRASGGIADARPSDKLGESGRLKVGR